MWKREGGFLVFDLAAAGRGCEEYDIALNSIRTAAQALGWIDHIAKKQWADDACVASLAKELAAYVDEHVGKIHPI